MVARAARVLVPAVLLAMLALPRIAHAQELQPLPPPATQPTTGEQPAPSPVAQPAPVVQAQQPSAPPAAPQEPASTSVSVIGSEPAKDGPAKKTRPRYWLTATGAVTFGGAYVANAVLFPLAVISPPDGPSSPSTLWYVTPVVGPFALASKLSQWDTGLRRFEWIDGSLQSVGLLMVAASFLFPEEQKTEKHETATIQPVVSPRFIGASGTF